MKISILKIKKRTYRFYLPFSGSFYLFPYLDSGLQFNNPRTMSRLTQIDLEHMFHSVMMSFRPGVSTFLFHLASSRPDSSVHRFIPGASSVPLFTVYLFENIPFTYSVSSHYCDKKESHVLTLHEKQPSVEIVLSSAGGI
jgi:hypothetical protein